MNKKTWIFLGVILLFIIAIVIIYNVTKTNDLISKTKVIEGVKFSNAKITKLSDKYIFYVTVTTTKQDILELDLEGTEVSEEEYDINLAISFDYEGAALELESLNKYSIIEEMPEVDLSNSKPIEDMPEKEKEVYDMFFGNLDLIIDIEDDLEESL